MDRVLNETEWSRLAVTIEKLHAKHVGEDVVAFLRRPQDDRQLLRTLYENMEELVNTIKEVTEP
jgi:hypothetical protein